MADLEIHSVGDLLEHIEKSNVANAWTPHVQLWFRGHQNSSWSLEPNVYRAGLPQDEDAQIKYERHLSQDFRSFSAGLRPRGESIVELYFIQQHYGMPTRLLDWTGSPLAALFFSMGSPNVDAKIYMLDSYGFRGGQMMAHREELEYTMTAIYNWNDTAWPANIIAVRPPDQDYRIVAQRGFFTFHPIGKRVLSLNDNDTLTSFLIPASAKARISEELDRLNINEFTVYGGLDFLARWLKRVYSDAPNRQRKRGVA